MTSGFISKFVLKLNSFRTVMLLLGIKTLAHLLLNQYEAGKVIVRETTTLVELARKIETIINKRENPEWLPVNN